MCHAGAHALTVGLLGVYVTMVGGDMVPPSTVLATKTPCESSVRKSGSVRFFAPKTGNCRLQLV